MMTAHSFSICQDYIDFGLSIALSLNNIFNVLLGILITYNHGLPMTFSHMCVVCIDHGHPLSPHISSPFTLTTFHFPRRPPVCFLVFAFTFDASKSLVGAIYRTLGTLPVAKPLKQKSCPLPPAISCS